MGWRRPHNEELHSLYRLLDIVSVIKSSRSRWIGEKERMEKGRSAFKIDTGIHTGKIHLEKPRQRWEDNVRMDFKEVGVSTRNWVDWAQDRNY